MRANHRVHKAIEVKRPTVLNNAGSLPPSAEGGLVLQDNRPTSVLQQKRLNALNAVQAHQPPIQKKANNTGLPDNLKSGVENLSGIVMNDVNVHYNSVQPAQLNAHVYAQGTDIHIAPGQEKHLLHEAWHVVQQKQGRVKPTLQMKAGIPVNDDKSLEHEADMMGRKALQLKTQYNNLPRASFVRARTVQRVGEEDATEHEQSGRFIINDNQPVSGKQVHKTDFLNALSASITGVADEVLAKVHQTSASCPYIAYWFSHYENQTPAYIERALARYAPGALTADSWQDCVHAVSTRVKTAFQNHVATGTLNGVPEGVPKDLIEETKPQEKPSTVQLMADVAQLCCCCEDDPPPSGSSVPEAKADAKATSVGTTLPSTPVLTGAGQVSSSASLLTPQHRSNMMELTRSLESAGTTLRAELKKESVGDEKRIGAAHVEGGIVASEDETYRTKRRRVEADDGTLSTTEGARIFEWLNRVRTLIQEKKYKNAYDLLTNKSEAATLGITMERLPTRSGETVIKAAEKSMSFAAKKTIRLTAPGNQDIDPKTLTWLLEDPDMAATYLTEDTSWLSDESTAKKVLTMYLEEYMHQYQARTNRFLSPFTGKFKEVSGLKDISNRKQKDQDKKEDSKDKDEGADYDEIDVMAQLHDWGFDVEEIEYVKRYPEREKFWAWMESSGNRPRKQ